MTSAAWARARVDAELRAWLDAGGRTAEPGPTPAPPDAPAKRARRRLTFQAVRIPFDLPAAPLALGAGDLDGDGTAELVALTADHVVVLSLERDVLRERARLALEGPPAAPRPRTPVGTLVVADIEGDGAPEILAASSEHAAGVRLGWKDGALVRLPGDPPAGYPLAALRDGARVVHVAAAPLGPGTHDFPRAGLTFTPAWDAGAPAELPERFLALEAGWVPRPSGAPQLVVAAVDGAGWLRVARSGHKGPWLSIDGAGTAFEVVDLDDDGQPEVVTSAYRAPGDGDALVVRAVKDDGTTRSVYRDALRGGIAGIAAGDLDGDGILEVAAAARLPGSRRGELWVLR